MKSLNFNTILLICITALLTLQLKSCFDPSRIDRKVIEAEVKLKQYEEQLPAIRKELDVIYAKYDSLLTASVQRYENLESKKEPIIIRMKGASTIVNNLDKGQLRKAIESY